MFLNRILQQIHWRLFIVWTLRYPSTEVDGFDAFAEILFEIKIDVGNRVDILVTGLTNYKIITCSCADLIYKWHFFTQFSSQMLDKKTSVKLYAQ